MNPLWKRVLPVFLAFSAGGLTATAVREGSSLVAYKDSGGTWTIGNGSTKGVKPGDTITKEQERELLKRDAAIAEGGVKRHIKVPLYPWEYDALTDFVFNVGETNFKKSTLVKKFNKQDYHGGCRQFFVWNKVKGQFSQGVLNRRIEEYDQCIGLPELRKIAASVGYEF